MLTTSGREIDVLAVGFSRVIDGSLVFPNVDGKNVLETVVVFCTGVVDVMCG